MEPRDYWNYEETTHQHLGSSLGHSKTVKGPKGLSPLSSNEDVAALSQGDEQWSLLLCWKHESLVRTLKTRREELILNFNELEMIIQVSS